MMSDPGAPLSFQLANGLRMPAIGLGTWQATKDEVKLAVNSALDNGYRLIDTAYGYGNEAHIGEILKERFERGHISRRDVFITTKLSMAFHARDKVVESLKTSLERLGTDYVDMYLIHTPCAVKKAADSDRPFFDENGKGVPDNVDLLDTWKGMEDAYKAGLTRAIGCSNFNIEQLERICKNCEIPPNNLQVECHLYFQQRELHDYCKSKKIVLTAYAPLGSPGRLTYKATLSKNWPNPGDPLRDERVTKIAKSHNKTPAQVFDFALSADEMTTLSSIDVNQRLFISDYAVGHPEDPYKTERQKFRPPLPDEEGGTPTKI